MSEKLRKDRDGTVYYDGDCPMCRAFVAGVKKDSGQDNLEFSNFQTGPLPADFSLDSLKKEIHFVDSNGVVYRNVHAVAKILELQGISKALTSLLKIPGVAPIAVLIYRFIAMNRYQIFGPSAKLFWIKLAVIIFLLCAVTIYLFTLIV